MSYEAEVPKEYLREAFHSGALDVTTSFEQVRGFVQIFAGEMDALVAIQHCNFLSAEEIAQLVKIARPSAEAVFHYRTWLSRIGA